MLTEIKNASVDGPLANPLTEWSEKYDDVKSVQKKKKNEKN